MDRKNRLKEAYKYLQSIGKIHTQKGFADALGKGKNYLLCVMDNYKDYHDFTSRWDKALKKIGTTEIVPDRVGRRRKVVYHPLYPNITTYTARYTFASIAANDCEIPTETIGKCLAHAWSKNTVTARYISDDRRKVDKAFALVLDKVRG